MSNRDAQEPADERPSHNPDAVTLAEAFEAIATAMADMADDPGRLLQVITDQALCVFSCDSTAVLRPAEDDPGELAVIAWSGFAPADPAPLRFSLHETHVGQAFSSDSGRVIANFAGEPAEAVPLGRFFEAGSGVFIPMQPAGILALLSRRERVFADSQLPLAEAFSSFASAGIRLGDTQHRTEPDAAAQAMRESAAFLLLETATSDEMPEPGGIDEVIERLEDSLHHVRESLTRAQSNSPDLGPAARP